MNKPSGRAQKKTVAPSKKLDKSDWSLQKNIAFRMSCVISRMDQNLRDTVLRDLNLTYMHYRVLQVLYEQDGQMIGDIARVLVARQPALSRVIDQMEERTLVRRVPDAEDNRYIRVSLTALGRQRYEEAWPAAHAIIEQGLEVISPQEREALLDILTRMDEGLNKG